MTIKSLKQCIWQLCISRDFIKKVRYYYFTDLTFMEKLVYLIAIRPFSKNKFFFEGNLRIEGQLNIAERRALYTYLVERKARNYFEVGTWRGGGSTYFAASAFKQLGKGMVYTSENDPKTYHHTVQAYKQFAPTCQPFVIFLETNNLNDFLPYLEKEKIVDAVFLDGSDIPEETVAQFNFFAARMQSGSLLMLHDWDFPKMSALRPLLTETREWKLLLRLEPPLSRYGFVVFEKI